MRHLDKLAELICLDQERMTILSHVRNLALPDCWIGAGFVRNLIWDVLHKTKTPLTNFDIDVVYFDPSNVTSNRDIQLETQLGREFPEYEWSVKNQVRMHSRNFDKPYSSVEDAISKWPETATCVGVQLSHDGSPQFLAPYGLEDIFDLVIRPTPHFRSKMNVFEERIRSKPWLSTWPKLRVEASAEGLRPD